MRSGFGENFVKFEPQGVTGVLVLGESHLSIHTYPEEGFAAVDCYTCGAAVDPEVACRHIMDGLTRLNDGELIYTFDNES